MQVVKRDGSRQDVSFDKVTARIAQQSDGLDGVNVIRIAQQVCTYIHDGVTTKQLDVTAANICSSLIAQHPDHDTLAARLVVSNMHKETPATFTAAMARLGSSGRVSEELMDTVTVAGAMLDSAIEQEQDYAFDYFGICTLTKNYLIHDGDGLVERPQYMFMRVALGIHGANVEAAIGTYWMMSQRLMVHATPTLFNAGTERPQMSSCYLVDMFEDSIDGIYDTLKECASISKYAGGIGLSVSDVRASGAYIKGTNGRADGIVPMAQVYNATARYVNQGGKRKGAMAMYIEPWHADIMAFVDLRRNGGSNEERTRDLFLSIWAPDLFMRRVESGGDWSLMCPHECPGLTDVCGKDFDELYERYEREGRYRERIPAQQLMNRITDAQIETGMPYFLAKCSANLKSNQQHLGVIKSSNLCAEIIEFASKDEVAVCNLASICLPQLMTADGFSYDILTDVTGTLVRNLNAIIDRNYYPTQRSRESNLKHRPIGIGVQGLADVFTAMGFPFDSPEAFALERSIFRTIYHAAMMESVLLAAEFGTYASYEGSPLSNGILQPDMWPGDEARVGCEAVSVEDWNQLREALAKHGARNSLLVALMPTATTSQIMGSAGEAMEPYSSMLFTRKTLAGEFIVVNRSLVRTLDERGLWNERVKEAIMKNDGSVAGLDDLVPADVQALYMTVWDLKQKVLIDHARNRAAFVDQSQSMNLFMAAPTRKKVQNALMYGWRSGLKTCLYYLRTKPAARAQRFTIEPSAPVREEDPVCAVCSA